MLKTVEVDKHALKLVIKHMHKRSMLGVLSRKESYALAILQVNLQDADA
jgi:hypothetical protein